MLVDIQDKLDNPNVRRILSESMFDKSFKAVDRKTAEFQRRDDWYLYGWSDNNEILGVCLIEVHLDGVVIINIAVDPNIRKHGIGKAMITALCQKYILTIKAETDDDAVEFYRKCGFKTEGFIKEYDNTKWRRYKCELSL